MPDSRPGAGDCGSNVAVMLELLNTTVASLLLAPSSPELGPQVQEGKDGEGEPEGTLRRDLGEALGGGACGGQVLFLFNTGEEDGLLGAHAFITQVSQPVPEQW